MTRKTLWQLTAIAAAAGVLGIAQAQSDLSSQPASDRIATPQAELAAQPVTTEATTVDSTAAQTSATTTTTSDTATTTTPGAEAPPVQTGTIVVVPAQVDHAKIAEKAWATVQEEPVTREDVVSEAVYANRNGLIPRGELAAVNEDKGSLPVDMADQARHERSTTQVLARVEARHQQFAAVEQERLNQLAEQERQRQLALAEQQQREQQQQMAQQEQPQQQPTQ